MRNSHNSLRSFRRSVSFNGSTLLRACPHLPLRDFLSLGREDRGEGKVSMETSLPHGGLVLQRINMKTQSFPRARLIIALFVFCLLASPLLSQTASVAVSPSIINEADDATFTFTLSPAPSRRTTIHYIILGTAIPRFDYLLSGKFNEVVFQP